MPAQEDHTTRPNGPNAWLLRLGFGLFKLVTYLPWPWLMALGRSLGRIAMLVTPSRVRITDINLKLCFPELDTAARRRLCRQHFESLGMGMMDMGLAWWAPEARVRPWLQVQGTEHIAAALDQGRGVILLTAHFTSLEMGARTLRGFGPLHPVYRPQRNQQLDHLINTERLRHVEWAIPRHDMRLLIRTLRDGRGVWFAPDQHFSNQGYLFSPFFGIPAATNTATSRCARLSGAPVVPFVITRRDDATGYKVVIEPALEGFPSTDLQQDTDRINAIFERWIRQAPAQYLWSHRRFKDRPEGASGFY